MADSPADLLIYGMGEKPICELARRLKQGIPFQTIRDIPQTAYITHHHEPVGTEDIRLFSFEECLKDKRKQAQNFRIIEEESNKHEASRMIQQTGKRSIVVNPPYPPMTTAEIDASFDLPYTRLPHPKYKDKIIPAC